LDTALPLSLLGLQLLKVKGDKWLPCFLGHKFHVWIVLASITEHQHLTAQVLELNRNSWSTAIES